MRNQSAFVFPAMAFVSCELTFLFLYDGCLVLARLPALRVLLMFFSGLFGFSELNFQVVRAATRPILTINFTG